MQESCIISNFNYIGRFYFSKKAQKLVLRFLGAVRFLNLTLKVSQNLGKFGWEQPQPLVRSNQTQVKADSQI
ncbi:MAG TPA: hypothetical protein DCM71_22985 [Runella sp.]|nr:hypothetical protein [Runella sp.]